MSASRSKDGEPPRKRVRKGTRSCWECKRRKIKCQLSSEDVPVCSGCLTRGTPCLSQEFEYPEDQDTSKGTQVGERLGRVEQLLENLVAKICSFEDEQKSQQVMTPDSIGNDVLTPFTVNVEAASHQEGAPFVSLYDNTTTKQRDNSQSQMPTPTSQSSSTKTACCRVPKIERTRQALVELLPSQKDVDLLYKSASGWLLFQALTDANKDTSASATLNMAEVQKRHPTSIARTLLYLALCLQQISPDSDTSKLSLFPSVEGRMEKYIAVVQSLVTSDDELITTLDGLECLVLMALFHINAGNPRRAWLFSRKSLDIGQLMGIHKRNCTIPGSRDMWYQIMRSDRYLALLLGLPAGSGDITFGPEETFQNPDIDKDELFVRKLGELSGRIIERNQVEDSHAYAATQEVDESLDKLAKQMPQRWWDIPPHLLKEQGQETALNYDRAMAQIWFFQLQSLLHMPFMLRASTERRYDYNKFICLKSSREMLWRYLALRHAGYRSFCCKMVDFAALTATVTLFLDLLESPSGSNQQQKDTDRGLIADVLTSMEALSRGEKDIVATQSVNVIRSLQAVDSPSGGNTGNLKLTIPYFGTINIARPSRPQLPKSTPNVPVSFPPSNLPAILPEHDWQNISYTDQSPIQDSANLPQISFTSSQFATDHTGMQNYALTEADTLFFDSLLDTDLEGKWVF